VDDEVCLHRGELVSEEDREGLNAEEGDRAGSAADRVHQGPESRRQLRQGSHRPLQPAVIWRGRLTVGPPAFNRRSAGATPVHVKQSLTTESHDP